MMTTRERQAMSKLHKERGALLRRMRTAKNKVYSALMTLPLLDRLPLQVRALDAALKALTLPRGKR